MQKVELEGCIQLRLRGGQDARERPCSFPCTLESDVWSSNSGAFVLPLAWALPPPKTSCLLSSQLPSQIVNRILPITTAGLPPHPSHSDMRWGPWETAVVDRSAFSYKNTLLPVTDCPGGWVWGVGAHCSSLDAGRWSRSMGKRALVTCAHKQIGNPGTRRPTS